MKKFYFLLLIICFAVFLCGCPSDIKPEFYGYYNISGHVLRDGTPVSDVLIEVRSSVVDDDAEASVVSSVQNVLPSFIIARAENDADSEDDGSSDDASSESGGSTADDGSSGGSGGGATDDSSKGSGGSTTDDSGDAGGGDKTTPKTVYDNPVLGECRTDSDGYFSLRFKAYESAAGESFCLTATDKTNNNEVYSETVDFSETGSDPTNNYGSYYKSDKSKTIEIDM